jgi:hypothetical protein
VSFNFMVKVFPSGSFYAERALDCLVEKGFDRKDFSVVVDYPGLGEASILTHDQDTGDRVWAAAKDCLNDPADDPMPKGLLDNPIYDKKRLRFPKFKFGDVVKVGKSETWPHLSGTKGIIQFVPGATSMGWPRYYVTSWKTGFGYWISENEIEGPFYSENPVYPKKRPSSQPKFRIGDMIRVSIPGPLGKVRRFGKVKQVFKLLTGLTTKWAYLVETAGGFQSYLKEDELQSAGTFDENPVYPKERPPSQVGKFRVGQYVFVDKLSSVGPSLWMKTGRIAGFSKNRQGIWEASVGFRQAFLKDIWVDIPLDDLKPESERWHPGGFSPNPVYSKTRPLPSSYDLIEAAINRLKPITQGSDVHRRLVLWTCEIAERVLRLYEQKYPGDMRPRKAIAAARAWAKEPTEKNRDAALAAGDAAEAARDATWAAVAATRTAMYAAWAVENAAWAAGHAARYATMAAVDATGEAEFKWQLSRLYELVPESRPGFAPNPIYSKTRPLPSSYDLIEAAINRLKPITQGSDVHRRLVLWTCEIAERVLRLYEQKYPGNVHPRQAIAAARAWAKEPTRANATAAWAAGNATRAAGGATLAAENATWAAMYAALAAATTAWTAGNVAWATGAAARAAWNAARAAMYATLAAENAAEAAGYAARAAESRWQLTRLYELIPESRPGFAQNPVYPKRRPPPGGLKVGSRVKLANGPYAGQTGTIFGISTPDLSIFPGGERFVKITLDQGGSTFVRETRLLPLR